MDALSEEADTRILDSGNSPVIHADETYSMQVVGDRMWVMFVEKQPINGQLISVTTGYLSFKIEGVMPAIAMALDHLATARTIKSKLLS